MDGQKNIKLGSLVA